MFVYNMSKGEWSISKDTALLIIDVQNEMFDEAYPVYEPERLIGNLKHLIAKARSANVSIIYVQHNEKEGLVHGSRAWEIPVAIAPNPEDLIIQKWTPDSFHETNLQDELKSRGIEKLVMSGIQSEMCVDTTCRRAFSLGYDVTLVQDAHSTWNSEHLSARQIIDHENATLRWFADLKESRGVDFSI